MIKLDHITTRALKLMSQKTGMTIEWFIQTHLQEPLKIYLNPENIDSDEFSKWIKDIIVLDQKIFKMELIRECPIKCSMRKFDILIKEWSDKKKYIVENGRGNAGYWFRVSEVKPEVVVDKDLFVILAKSKGLTMMPKIVIKDMAKEFELPANVFSRWAREYIVSSGYAVVEGKDWIAAKIK